MLLIKVEEIRQSLGLNQTEMAKIVGCTSRTYQNKVYGIVDWKLDEIIKIAELIDDGVEVNGYIIKANKL